MAMTDSSEVGANFPEATFGAGFWTVCHSHKNTFWVEWLHAFPVALALKDLGKRYVLSQQSPNFIASTQMWSCFVACRIQCTMHRKYQRASLHQQAITLHVSQKRPTWYYRHVCRIL